MDEAAREVNDGGDAHYRQEPSAGHAERWATTAGVHGARLDRVVDTLASLDPKDETFTMITSRIATAQGHHRGGWYRGAISMQ